jgi:hypothetical protein
VKVPDTHFTELEGVQAVDAFFTKLKWLFRPQLRSDFGIDAHVERVEDGRATGRLLALQIKSGSSLGRLLSRMSRRGWGRVPLRCRPRHDEEVSLGAAQDAFALKAEGDRDLP